jgi:hypothetical protein
MPTRDANIELQIEELILHDLPYDQRHRVAAAIEQALTRMLAERGLPAGFSEGMPSIDAGTVYISPHRTAETVGLQVADWIYRQLPASSTPAVAQATIT